MTNKEKFIEVFGDEETIPKRECVTIDWWDQKYVPVDSPTDLIHCKDCKYFEYDSTAKVDGIPLIVAHEICTRWGEGCKSREDGFCFLAERKEVNDAGNS